MKHYTHHDPILDKGKAVPKPHNPGTSGCGLFCRVLFNGLRGHITRPIRSSEPRVRMSKKRRIVLRDLEHVNRYGFSDFTDRFMSIKRRVRVAKESFLRAEPCYGLRVAAGIIDPNR